ncbi:MAG: hypothetical protein ACT6FB_00700 [Methanosarcinaceae archaeon]
MDKRYPIVLVVGFLTAFAIMSFNLTTDMFLWGILAASIIFAVLMLLYLTSQRSLSQNEETEIVESEALTDSRISKSTTSFVGIPFFIVFGGLWGKYESMFTVRYGSAVVVLYYGLCIVSKNDKLRIIGKRYNGNKVGIEGDFIIASRIENVSSGIVFDTV